MNDLNQLILNFDYDQNLVLIDSNHSFTDQILF